VEMDCITCHNRITHLVSYPEDIIDKLMDRDIISPSIPEIRLVALDTFYKEYTSLESAMDSFDLLDNYYQENHPDFYIQNSNKVNQAIQELKNSYTDTVSLEQKSDWASHSDNIGHENSPGCFRCHDGEHLSAQEEAIRLECNLCHSIPVVSEAGAFLTQIELSSGPEPETHTNTNWISLHHLVYDISCESCHTTGDPGGTSNTSFCSNSACHGVNWEFAGFDAPALRETIFDQLPTPQPTAVPVIIPEDPASITFDGIIQGIFTNRCGACHGEGKLAGLNLTSYNTALAGSDNGPVIIPGDTENSSLITKISGDVPHFSQLDRQELDLVVEWIKAGSPEN